MTTSAMMPGLPSRLHMTPEQSEEGVYSFSASLQNNLFTKASQSMIARSMTFFGEFGDIRLQAGLSHAGVNPDGSMGGLKQTVSDPLRYSSYSELENPASPKSAPDISHLVDTPHFGRSSRTESYMDLEPLRLDSEVTGNQDRLEQEIPRLSMPQVVVYLVTAILGCGVVVLPSLMKEGGWLVVPTLTGLTTLAFMEIARVMDSAIQKAEEKSCIFSFEDLGRAAMDQVGVCLIRVVTGTGFFGTLIVYTILIGHNVAGLFQNLIDVKTGILCVTPALLGLAVLKDSTIAKIMALGMFASLTSCVLICIKGYTDAHLWFKWPAQELSHLHNTWPDEPASVGTVLAVLFSAFSVMGTVPCIRGQMNDKLQFLPAFRRAMSIVFFMYLAVMLLGYWGYGNYVQHNVVDSMMFPPMTPQEAHQLAQGELPVQGHQSGRPVGIIMAVLVTLYLFLSFSLFFKCTAGMIQNLASGVCKLENGDTLHYVIRLMLVIVVVLVAMAVPHFREVMAIMSSVCCSCNNVFFPLLFAFKLEDTGFRVSLYQRAVHACIFILALFCFSLGLFNSVSNLAKEMSS